MAEDFKTIDQAQNDEEIRTTNTTQYKKNIKSRLKQAAFKYLKEIQSKHSKVKDISYENLETQKYITNPIFSNEEVNVKIATIDDC